MATLAENKISKRNRILESAYDLFTRKSVTATPIDDVVKMAGVAKGTFYLYFKDKYDLMDQIIAYKSAEIVKKAADIVSINNNIRSLEEKVLCMADYIVDSLNENKELTALLSKNFSRCFRIIHSGNSEESAELMNRIVSPFEKNGYTREEAGKIIYIIVDMVGSVCCDAILGLGPFSLDEIRESLKKCILGILEVHKF